MEVELVPKIVVTMYLFLDSVADGLGGLPA